MEDTKIVDGETRVMSDGGAPQRTVSTKYPVPRIKLLEAAQADDGDAFLSDQVRRALDRYLAARFPGIVGEEDA